MAYSNSSLTCYTACERKYYHTYIAKSPRCKPESPHLAFGVMAHEVLHRAGDLRDKVQAGEYVSDYMPCIPSEVSAHNLKEVFAIRSWREYFVPVCKQVAKYEQELCRTFDEVEMSIHREIRLSVTGQELVSAGYIAAPLSKPLVGVIDFLLLGEKHATIIDYKFSTSVKTQDDFDMNSQLQLYALLVNLRYGVPLTNIKIGYMDIPKSVFGKPKLLSNGTLSRAKDQNVDSELYIEAVKAVHGADADMMLMPGGHYYEIVKELALRKAAYLTVQYIDTEAFKNIIDDLLHTAMRIESTDDNVSSYLSKYDSYSCKSCEFLTACKPWLEVNK